MKYLKYDKRIIRYIIILIVFLLCGTVYCVQRSGRTPKKGTADFIDAASEDDLSKESSDSSDSNTVQKEGSENMIFIHMCGCVNDPGVYQVQDEARVYELVELAGGFSEDADTQYINLVDKVSDGQKIYIPSKEENLGSQTGITAETDNGSKGKGGLVNINTAGKELLMTLPGIGESKAVDIIKYRSDQTFKKAEDIMNISGIKEAAYNKIKDLICVN